MRRTARVSERLSEIIYKYYIMTVCKRITELKLHISLISMSAVVRRYAKITSQLIRKCWIRLLERDANYKSLRVDQ